MNANAKFPVINWWNETWTTQAPAPISLLLFTSLLTPLVLMYLLIVPVHFVKSRLNHAGLIIFTEGAMMLLWAAGSIANAEFIRERVCFGTVCDLAIAATVLGIFQWYVICTHCVVFGLMDFC